MIRRVETLAGSFLFLALLLAKATPAEASELRKCSDSDLEQLAIQVAVVRAELARGDAGASVDRVSLARARLGLDPVSWCDGHIGRRALFWLAQASALLGDFSRATDLLQVLDGRGPTDQEQAEIVELREEIAEGERDERDRKDAARLQEEIAEWARDRKPARAPDAGSRESRAQASDLRACPDSDSQELAAQAAVVHDGRMKASEGEPFEAWALGVASAELTRLSECAGQLGRRALYRRASVSAVLGDWGRARQLLEETRSRAPSAEERAEIAELLEEIDKGERETRSMNSGVPALALPPPSAELVRTRKNARDFAIFTAVGLTGLGLSALWASQTPTGSARNLPVGSAVVCGIFGGLGAVGLVLTLPDLAKLEQERRRER
jgi:hypothetical protein